MAEKRELTTTTKKYFLRPHSTVMESKDGKLEVVMEMPGVRKEDLDIKLENNQLTVQGKRDPLPEAKYILRERHQGDYLQVFTLDDTVDRSRVDAKLQNGVLTVTLELKEQVKPRTIQIKAG